MLLYNNLILKNKVNMFNGPLWLSEKFNVEIHDIKFYNTDL